MPVSKLVWKLLDGLSDDVQIQKNGIETNLIGEHVVAGSSL